MTQPDELDPMLNSRTLRTASSEDQPAPYPTPRATNQSDNPSLLTQAGLVLNSLHTSRGLSRENMLRKLSEMLSDEELQAIYIAALMRFNHGNRSNCHDDQHDSHPAPQHDTQPNTQLENVANITELTRQLDQMHERHSQQLQSMMLDITAILELDE